MTTKQAISQLIKALKRDKQYFYSWQANIAMAFKDELSRRGYEFPEKHEIANVAAKKFLNQLIGPPYDR